MGSGGSSTMLAYVGSLDRRPSLNHACPTSKRAGLFELLHAACRCRGDAKTRSGLEVQRCISGLASACSLPLQMMFEDWQSLSCVMTGSHVA